MRNLERELGVDLLERKRSGARMSAEGRELLPHLINVLDAVDRLRGAAGEQHRISRTVRVGTVNAATVPLLIPTVRELRAAHPLTQVEVVAAQQTALDGREALIAMRSGYVMHRCLHRFLEGRGPALAYTTDGAETGELTDDTTRVLPMLRRRRAESVPRAAHDLHEAFARRAAELGTRLSGRP